MTGPEVTIVTATLNRESLALACESVDRQTYPHWRHYVLGDGVLPVEYAHPRRSTIGFSVPMGALETSIDCPEGTPYPLLRWALANLNMSELFCVLDDDNVYDAQYLETMVKLLTDSPSGIAVCALHDLRDDAPHDGYPEPGRCDMSGFITYTAHAREVNFEPVEKDKFADQDVRFIVALAERFGSERTGDKLVTYGAGPRTRPPLDRLDHASAWAAAGGLHHAEGAS